MDALPETLCEFAVPGPLRDQLVCAVLAGEKTATSGLLADYEHEGEPLPRPGDRETVVDSDGRPVAVIEVTGCEVIALGDADLALAIDEGEGFASVQEWRDAHERFWREESLPIIGLETLDDLTPIVVMRFRLVDLVRDA
ncbi:MAG TPA: ASCH domain-containing protein [Capillimicrobium sp.]|jgi:uncharacterized protein YhfF